MDAIRRKTHLLGVKLKQLRKRNQLTLDEVSARCVTEDASLAPSVSYLSMIESGKRVPSVEMLELLGKIFQRDVAWFLDETTAPDVAPAAPRRGGQARLPLEPAFLFSRELLQVAIPELLQQTGTTGRQFAHLLIRSHQEISRNDFPELERAAESIGKRRFPLSPEDLLQMCRELKLEIRWFERRPLLARDKEREVRSMVRSFYEPPGVLYVNKALQNDPARLKFDLAAHIAHKVLHGGDGMKSAHASGGEMGGSPEASSDGAAAMNANDVLHAWRDFECTFFAGALLAPKVPFRRFLAQQQHRIDAACERLVLTPAVVMRRMTKVAPYPHWHFFDAYPPGYLRAVYRGNGIPLPWGNMAQVSDPCPQWAVFRMLDDHGAKSGAQLSLLRDGDRSLLYCCYSTRTTDMAGNPHVLSVGVDLLPALDANHEDSQAILDAIFDECRRRKRDARVPAAAAAAIARISAVLNIAWLGDALNAPARIICPRSSRCPRADRCEGAHVSKARAITDVRAEILASLRR
jgi:transcriptional regulator with XRE-family HTH domain/Zn-dependent peptidase ImmA (M78 family)